MGTSKKVLIKKEISIFRTSINSPEKITLIKALLNTLVGSGNWNFDLEDNDYILRIYYQPILKNFLAREINKMGVECVELDYY